VYYIPTISLIANYYVILLKAGQPVRLFHREIEAYLSAEGLFDEKLVQDGNYFSTFK